MTQTKNSQTAENNNASTNRLRTQQTDDEWRRRPKTEDTRL